MNRAMINQLIKADMKFSQMSSEEMRKGIEKVIENKVQKQQEKCAFTRITKTRPWREINEQTIYTKFNCS